MIIKHYRAVKETDRLYVGQRIFLKLTSEHSRQAYKIQGTIIQFLHDFRGSCLGVDINQYYLYIKWDNSHHNSYRLNDIVIEDTMVIPETRGIGIMVKAKKNIFRDSADDVTVYGDANMPYIIPENTCVFASLSKDIFMRMELFRPFNNLWRANLRTSNFEIINSHLTFEL